MKFCEILWKIGILFITAYLKFESKNPFAQMRHIICDYLPQTISFCSCVIDYFQLNTYFPSIFSIFNYHKITYRATPR